MPLSEEIRAALGTLDLAELMAVHSCVRSLMKEQHAEQQGEAKSDAQKVA